MERVDERTGIRAHGPALLLILAILTAFLLHCRRTESRAASEPPPIEIRASVLPAQAITITAQIDGQVSNVAVTEGTVVTANAPIADLSNAAVERDAVATRAQLAWIDARLRRGGRRPAAAGPARPRDTLEITAKILELRRNRFNKMKALRKTNDVTARELEVVEIEYLAALRDYNNERRAVMGPAVITAAATDDTELLRIEREKTEADQKFAAQRQSLLHIVSPIAGTVTRVYVVPGQSLLPREPIADVADVATLHVRGTVAPELLRYVKAGTRVEVKVLSIPPRSFADEIEYVVPVQGGEQARGASVIVAIPNPDRSLQPNTEALITIRSLR